MLQRVYKYPKYAPSRFNREYVDIERRVEGVVNSTTGEPAITWAVRTSNAVCNIIPGGNISGEQLSYFQAGLIHLASDLGLFTVGVTIIPRDRIKNYDGNYYDVLDMKNYRTHKEVLLRILEPDA